MKPKAPLASALAVLLGVLPTSGWPQSTAKSDGPSVSGITVIVPAVPVPKVGEGAPAYSEAELKAMSSKAQAEAFYAVHAERPFYGSLVAFMTSGPVVVQVLEGENAIAKNREVMGATNPEKAAAGTIRKDFAENMEANSVHGSDAPETAANEIKFFFRDLDIVG